MESKVVITDTSCFILLEKIRALHVLHELFEFVLTTPVIAKEYGNPLPSWVTVQSAAIPLNKELSRLIDEGEASAIALAMEVSCDYIILDDIDARKLAERIGLHVKGTVGVLLKAKQDGLIPLLKPYIELIQQTNFRLSDHLAEQFIRWAGEA